MVFKSLASSRVEKSKLILMHIFVWGLFILYEVSFVYSVTGKLQSVEAYAFAYARNVVIFYVNVWCLNFAFTKGGSGYIFIPLLLAEFIFYLIIVCFLNSIADHWKVPISGYLSKILVLQYIYRAIYFIGISVGYWFVLQLLRSNNLINKMESRNLIQQKRSAELERNLFKAHNAYLTSQINPHLLFNTLNFIYSNLYEVSKKAAETVVLLSDMMRYSLTEIGEDGKVEIAKEIEHIDNMVQLNQARFNDNLHIKTHFEGNFELRIIPLVFLTFVENIFKHGDMSDPEYPARINISCFNNVLEFYSSNKIRKLNINKGTGIGVENSKIRLDMAYPDKYKLTTEVIDGQFITSLIINFN